MNNNVLFGNTGTDSPKLLRRGVRTARFTFVALAALFTLSVTAWSGRKPALVVKGEVQATECKVIPKVTGRVQALHVCKGDKVRKGQLLVSLENQELQAKLEQARAAMKLAKEHNQIVQEACVESLCALSNWWVETKAVAEHAEQTLNHARASRAAEAISLKELQDSERDCHLARSSERAAKASFDLAVAVFGKEAKLAAAANFEQAAQRVAELERLVAELTITSPMDGEVQGRIVKSGELVSPGLPVVSIVNPQDAWVSFNVPEDLLPNVCVGTTFRVRVLALRNQEVLVKVNRISPNGGFAPSRGSEGTAGFDPKTFEVCAVPVQAPEGFRPGLSAVLTLRKFD